MIVVVPCMRWARATVAAASGVAVNETPPPPCVWASTYPGTIVFPILQDDGAGGLVDLPGDDISFSNAEFVEEDYNDVDTYGARAALRIELDDSWTVTPQIMAQRQRSNGYFGDESGLREFQVQQFNDERSNDRAPSSSLCRSVER